MVAFLLGLFRLIWLFGKGHHRVVLGNLALRQQLSIYKRKQKRPRLADLDRWFWIALPVVWKDWRRALCVVHPTRLCAGSERVPVATGRICLSDPRDRVGLQSAIRSAR